MKGIELSRSYYEAFGRSMIENDFSDIAGIIAVGLIGSGSECYGFDDEISQDHDFEPGFCVFVPGEDAVDEKTMFRLERAYSRLPKEFEGYKRSIMDPVGGNRHGVFRASEFFSDLVGTPDGAMSVQQWLTTPDYAFAEALNGEVFRDDSGLVVKIRERLADMPYDIFLKKLAGNLVMSSQSGSYNYARIIRRGDSASAQFALFYYAQSIIKTVFLLNRRYSPYYKWQIRSMRQLPVLSETADMLEYLITTGNEGEMPENKMTVIGDLDRRICDALTEQGITSARYTDTGKAAYAINDRIENIDLRNLNILSGVTFI